MYVCVRMYVSVHGPMETRGGEEVSSSLRPHLILLRQGISLNLKLIILVRLPSQPAPRISLSVLLRAKATQMHSYVLFVLARNLNSGTAACTTDVLGH